MKKKGGGLVARWVVYVSDNSYVQGLSNSKYFAQGFCKGRGGANSHPCSVAPKLDILVQFPL